MATDQPILVYHGRSLAEAQDLATFLRENGVDTKLIEGDPLGHAHPASHVYHDVMAIDHDHEKLRELSEQWETLRATETRNGNQLFCYHCGHGLDAPVSVCPVCNASLVD